MLSEFWCHCQFFISRSQVHKPLIQLVNKRQKDPDLELILCLYYPPFFFIKIPYQLWSKILVVCIMKKWQFGNHPFNWDKSQTEKKILGCFKKLGVRYFKGDCMEICIQNLSSSVVAKHADSQHRGCQFDSSMCRHWWVSNGKSLLKINFRRKKLEPCFRFLLHSKSSILNAIGDEDEGSGKSLHKIDFHRVGTADGDQSSVLHFKGWGNVFPNIFDLI